MRNFPNLALSWHIVRRNWWVYRKDFIANISPTIADPLLFLLSLGVGLGAMVSQVDGHSYVEFLAPALTVSTALFTAFFETSYGFYVRMTFENVFKAMLTTPIGVGEVIVGEYIWVALKGAIMVFGVSLVLLAFGLFKNPLLLPLTVLIGILVALPCGAMGLLATSFVKNINQFQTVYSFIISPLFFMSGLFFPLDQMPQILQWIALALPLAHGVEVARAVFWNENVGQSFLIHGSILVLYSIVLCWLGFNRIRRKLQT